MQDQLQQPPLYSQNVKTKGRTYFFDVKEAKNGNKYLNITESWMRDGQKFRSTIKVFQNNLSEFCQAFTLSQEQAK